MKNCSRENTADSQKTAEWQNLQIQIRSHNSWYQADQFEQLVRPGTRVIIEQRWKYFERIILDHLKKRGHDYSSDQLNYLDAGCGDGVNLQWVRRFLEDFHINARVTALDYNPLRVGRVVHKQLSGETCIASLLQLPFGASTFDIVLCNHVLEHIKDYPLALSEIRRVLRPGGLLLLGVPNEGCFLAMARNKVIQRSILKKTDHVNFFRSDMLCSDLQGAGFHITGIFREGFFLPHFWAHYALTFFAWGGRLLGFLGRILPSQSAGLIVYATKPEDSI